MRTAPIGHSLIGEDFVIERELQSSLVEVNEFRLSVPRGADFGDHENVRVSLSISLTWRRPTSNSSHATKFYVVPKDTIDTDLLFGSVRSGPGAPGMYMSLVVALMQGHTVDVVRTLLRQCATCYSTGSAATRSYHGRPRPKLTPLHAGSIFTIISCLAFAR